MAQEAGTAGTHNPRVLKARARAAAVATGADAGAGAAAAAVSQGEAAGVGVDVGVGGDGVFGAELEDAREARRREAEELARAARASADALIAQLEDSFPEEPVSPAAAAAVEAQDSGDFAEAEPLPAASADAGAGTDAAGGESPDCEPQRDAADAHTAPRRRSVASGRSVARTVLRVLRIVIVILFVIAVALAGAFAVHRWVLCDDVADLQGTWYVAGTSAEVGVTADEIVLRDDVAYEYVLDTSVKTVSFAFGNLEGGGHFRFSLDRTQLAVMDGEFTWWDTLVDDAGWTVRAVLASIAGKQLSPAGEANVTLLTREPTPTSAPAPAPTPTPTPAPPAAEGA